MDLPLGNTDWVPTFGQRIFKASTGVKVFSTKGGALTWGTWHWVQK
jgi:hypothetical protein